MTNPYLSRLQELPKPNTIEYKHTGVSLFCGGGGLDLGLAFAGFDMKFASDVEAVHCETVQYNLPGCVTLPIDVKDLTASRIRELTEETSFDILAGGPPCQAFSILGKRSSFDDPRGRLVYEYVRLVKELQPQAFVFENVPGLLTINRGSDWKELLTYFQAETGYKFYHKILNSVDYGLPQQRRRVFVVGFRNPHVSFDFPEQTHKDPNDLHGLLSQHLHSWFPAKFALEDIDGTPNHRIRPHGERVSQRYSTVPPGGRDKRDHTDRIHPDRPSGTVLVGSKAGGGRPFIHPETPRHLTVREAARLQSFPDWYVFQGTDTWQYRAVGNAVPPLLAKVVGEQISAALAQLSETYDRTPATTAVS